MPRPIPHFGWPTSRFELNRESRQAEELRGWWPTLAGKGLRLYDVARRAAPGTNSGATWTSRSTMGAMLDYDGNLDKVSVAPVASINNLTRFTMAAWIVYQGPNAAGNHYLISKNGIDRIIYVFDGGADTNQLRGWVNRAGMQTAYNAAANTIPDNQVTHVAMTFDDARGAGQRIHLFVNAVRVATPVMVEGAGAINDDSAGNLIIGGRSTDNLRNWQGLIGDTRYWNRILTDKEIFELYHPGTRWDLYKTPMVPRARSPLAFLAERGVLRGAWRGIYRGM